MERHQELDVESLNYNSHFDSGGTHLCPPPTWRSLSLSLSISLSISLYIFIIYTYIYIYIYNICKHIYTVSEVGMAHIVSLEDVCAASPRPLASPRRQFLPAGCAPCDAVTIRAPATQIGSVVETCLETILERIRLVRSISARHHCGALPDERATVAHEACDGTVQMDARFSYEASHPSWAPLWGPLCAHGGPHYGPIAGPRGALFAFCGRPRVLRTHGYVDALEKKRHVNSLIWGPSSILGHNVRPYWAPLVMGPTRGPIMGA
jgi:hypothetical protein